MEGPDFRPLFWVPAAAGVALAIVTGIVGFLIGRGS